MPTPFEERPTLFEEREAWDREDRQQHLETIMNNMRKDAVYVDKGSFSGSNEAPSKRSKNDDNPENEGGLTP